MQRKAYVPGAAVLLAALLAACTGGSGSGGRAADPKAGSSTSAAAPQPGKYRTLADACSAVSHDTLDALLPGLTRIADEEQRDRAYQGEAALTYNNDRRSGCRWKAESPDATDHLFVDFERVVSYDNSVSDDNAAHQVYATKELAANLPEPSAGSGSSSGSPVSPAPGSSSGSASPSSAGSASASPSAAGASGSPNPSASASGSPSGSPSVTGTPADLQPRTLDDLGDEAFIDDELSTAQQRTVTVVFRTSNVIVTIEYDEQPAAPGTTPSSKDMQDKARKLAGQLAGSLG
ncbi:hypothetical protein [Streptomyces sp. Ru72]|uniref:hypothetical protein n=1 Tax=Streptomyces sp. Ru72 TaxID=2080747 RepID=UPI000CDDBD62|nr:hypothetical protein [Streptomyces sp. Ru72]POX53394.1 hypothetical protein C3488_05250 [Streptomyces sp. Ru72]